MYEIVQALLHLKPSFASGFTALSAAKNIKAAQAPRNTARSAECLALCPLPCCFSLFDQVAGQATAIPVPKLRTHWVQYISMNGSALQFLLKGRAHLFLCTAGSCKGAVCRLSVVRISGFVFLCVFFLAATTKLLTVARFEHVAHLQFLGPRRSRQHVKKKQYRGNQTQWGSLQGHQAHEGPQGDSDS